MVPAPSERNWGQGTTRRRKKMGQLGGVSGGGENVKKIQRGDHMGA